MIIFKENYENLVEIFKLSTKLNKPIIFPTDTIYGIGASIKSKTANIEIFKIKNRKHNKPFPILAGSIEQVIEIADISSLSRSNYIFFKENYNKYNTFILNAKENLDNIYKKDNKVAIRIPNKKTLAKAIIDSNMFITATSVNESGKQFLNSLDMIIEEFKTVDLFVYGKNQNRNTSSHIYDITQSEIIQLR